MYRAWAFWRRVQYGAGAGVFFACVSLLVYVFFIHQGSTCFDGKQNSDERGIDCGGACRLVCAFDAKSPVVLWSRSFKVTAGYYNAVAYVKNENVQFGTKKLQYTFTLVDAQGATILEKSGTTFLPPDSQYPIFEGRLAVGTRVPEKTFLKIEPVTEWEVFGVKREQFVVNSRALIGVDSTPRLDASITNTLIKEERDVEVIATIFNREGTALTASRTVVPRFEARAEKKVVFTWPEPIAKTLRSCEVPSDVIVAIDLSGSMNNDGGNPPEPITSALSAAAGFVSRLKTNDQVGVTTFATHGALSRTLSNDKVTTGAFIERLSIDPKEERGGTNIGDAILLAHDEFLSPRHSRDARKVLIVFTDGKATEPDPDPEGYARTAATKAKEADIDIFTIGLGLDLNKELLVNAATKPNQYYSAPDTRALDAIYRSISTAICEEGPAVIDIVPKVIGEIGGIQ